MDEQEFFARVSNRLGRQMPLTSPPRRDAVGAPAFWREYKLPTQERIGRFCRELSDLGGEAEVVDDITGLRNVLARRLADMRPGRVAVWGGSFLDEFGLHPVLEPYDTVIWSPPPPGEDDKRLHETALADVGITGCGAAVADTGTVAVVSSPTNGRSVSLLPPTHIVVIRASQLYTRLGEAFTAMTQRGVMPSAIHFITGPSRSSDIENDLSVGVHGPAAVVAVIVRNL
jgi:L-lactate dehydrogenase complex protein LldG